MTAKIYMMPGGERNTQFEITKRRAILARPDMVEKLRECEELLTAYHRNRLLSDTVDLPRNPRR